MSQNRCYELQSSGARLFYRLRGRGPLLLILAGGHGDADTTDALCEGLVDHYTVVTYDRRGLARSPLDPSTGPPTIATHSDDVHRLLAALTSEPTRVFGSSIGALIGLDLMARCPAQVRVLVAHEPPAWELLAPPERARASTSLEDVTRTFASDGAGAAFQKFAMLAAVDSADREPDVALPSPTPQVAANMKFFFTRDAPAINSYRLDLPALRIASTRLVAAAGESSGRSAAGQCAAALATTLGTAFVECPGGHTGWLLRPKAFATKLLEALR